MSSLPILALNAFSLLCVLAALLLIWRGRSEWGWFLFVAFLAAAGGDKAAAPSKPSPPKLMAPAPSLAPGLAEGGVNL